MGGNIVVDQMYQHQTKVGKPVVETDESFGKGLIYAQFPSVLVGEFDTRAGKMNVFGIHTLDSS